MLRRICVVQIQRRKRVLDHPDPSAPTLQRDLRTRHGDHIDQGSVFP